MNSARFLLAARRNAERNAAAVAALRPVKVEAEALAMEHWKNRKKPAEMLAARKAARELFTIPGFFPTPARIVARMLAECGSVSGADVLEPSAGRGDIADAARAAGGRVTCYELAGRLAGLLIDKGHTVAGADFMEASPREEFDFVLMNPPYERHADKVHTLRAFEWLRPGGLLVALVGGYTGASLREWADLTEDLPPGSFKTADRPTGVNVTLIVKAK